MPSASSSSASFGEDVTGTVDVRSYGELQEQLRAMSYVEPIGIESVPLVKRLLFDLISASESKEAMEASFAKAQREALELSQILLPLRKENAKLTRENNSLHLEIIQQEESISEREKACELQVESLRDEIKKLQFTTNQRAQLLQTKEEEIVKLQAQLERAISTGASIGMVKNQRALHSSTIEVKGTPLDAKRSSNIPNAKEHDESKVSNDSQVMMTRLEEQLNEMTAENKRLMAECDTLREKVNHREKEIDRLSKLSLDLIHNDDEATRKLREADKRYEKEALERAADLQLEQVTAQVDYLSDQIVKYDARLKEANLQLQRNDRLAERLSEADEANAKITSELNALRAKYALLEEELVRCQMKQQSQPSENEPEAETLAQNDPADEIQALKEQLNDLKQHKDRLEDALRASHYDKMSYTNALSNANSHNRVLSSDLARADAKVKDLIAKNERLHQEMADLKAKAESQARELEVLREGLRQAEETRSLEGEKNASLHRELRSMDKVLMQREEECRTLQHSVTIHKTEIQRLTQMLDTIRHETAEQDGDESSGNTKRSKALFLQEKKWLEEERQELRKSREDLMMKVMTLEEELQQSKSSLQSTQLEKTRLQEQLDLTKKSLEHAEKAVESKKSALVTAQEEIARQLEQLRTLQGQLQESQVLAEQAEQLEGEKIRCANEVLELRRRLDEARDQKASLKISLENSEAQVKKLTDQLQQLQRERTILEKTKSSLEKESAELQKSYGEATLELRNARQKANHHQSEYEKLLNELQTKDQSLNSEQSAAKTNRLYVEELKKQVGQLQSEVSLKQRSLHQTENRLEQEKLAHKAIQSQFVLVQDELLQVKELNQSLESSLRQLRTAIKDKEQTISEHVESITNLKVLMEQLESSKDQMAFKVKQSQQQIQRQNLQMDDLQNKMTTMQKDALAKATEITSLKKLTHELDHEKDQLHDHLDALTEKHQALVKQHTELKESMQSEASSVHDLRERLAQAVQQLTEREEQVETLGNQCKQQDVEIDRLRHQTEMQDAEMKALTQDLENMTIENQALSEECASVQFAVQQKDQLVADLKQTMRQLEHDRDALAIELEDLRHTYRSLVDEHQKLQQARTEVHGLQEELTRVNEQLRQSVASLESSVTTLEQKNQRLETEATTYREQVGFLSEKLRQQDEVLQESENKQSRLREELETQRNVSSEISAQRYGVEAQSAAISQRIVHLEAKLSNKEFELTSLRDKVQAEQSQRQSLENLVGSLRQKIAAHETTIAHLEEQREAMAHEIRSAHQRLVASQAMDVSELLHTPPSQLGAPRSTSSTPESLPSMNDDRSPESDATSAQSPSILPLHALQDAQEKCKALEDRLAEQDATIKQLERSRSKFKKFAAKYEKEIEQRDKLIEELRSSRASSGPRSRSGSQSSASSASSRDK